MPTLSSTFEFYNPWSTRNTHGTQPSITMPQMVDGQRPAPVLSIFSEKLPCAGYYRLGSKTHAVTYIVEGAFKGTCSLQITTVSNPGEHDWVNLPGSAVNFTGIETTGGDGISGGFSGSISRPTKTVLKTFTGNYAWVRAKLDISQGTLQAIKMNF